MCQPKKKIEVMKLIKNKNCLWKERSNEEIITIMRRNAVQYDERGEADHAPISEQKKEKIGPMAGQMLKSKNQ